MASAGLIFSFSGNLTRAIGHGRASGIRNQACQDFWYLKEDGYFCRKSVHEEKSEFFLFQQFVRCYLDCFR